MRLPWPTAHTGVENCRVLSNALSQLHYRATVEREIFDVIRPIVFEAFTPPAVLAATRDKLEQLLSEVWWAPAAGMPSPFEQRYEGFGCDMAVAVLNLFQVRAA